MIVLKPVRIDLARPARTVVHCMQTDNTQQVDVSLFVNNRPYDVTADVASGTTVTMAVAYILPNGFGDQYTETALGETAVEQDSTIKNLYHVMIDSACTDVVGFTQIIVKFTTEGGQILNSFPLTLDVIKSQPDDVDPDGNLPALSRYLRVDLLPAATEDDTGTVTWDADAKQLKYTPGSGGGGGVPSGGWGTSQIADGAITTAKLDSSAVTAVKIASGAVTEAKIGSGAVTSGKIGSGAVTEAKIADKAVSKGKLSQAVQDILDNAVLSSKFNPQALGIGLALSTTAGGTVPKTAALSGYELTANGLLAVHFTTPVEAGATLSILTDGSSTYTTAKPIYWRGQAITADVISYNDTAFFVYDGTNFELICVNKDEKNYGTANSGSPIVVGSDGKAAVGSWQGGGGGGGAELFAVTITTSSGGSTTKSAADIYAAKQAGKIIQAIIDGNNATILQQAASTETIFYVISTDSGRVLSEVTLNDSNNTTSVSVVSWPIGNANLPDAVAKTAAQMASGFSLAANNIYTVSDTISGFAVTNQSISFTKGLCAEIRLTVGSTAISSPTWPSNCVFMGGWDGKFSANTAYVIIIDDVGNVFHSERAVS